MSAPQEIINLVNKFKENEELYTNNDFDEENTKIEFINPFFKALGWDVDNEEGNSPQFKEVVFESSLRIGGQIKAPDYCFRLGGTPIFLVEAKKPSEKINTNKDHAYQVRRYGWNAKTDLCILTDFEEFSIYETTTKPVQNQNASIGRVKYYKYTDYIDKWDEIANIFSKESVKKGRFAKFVNNNSDIIKKGTGEVDNEFLKEIEKWRLLLAQNIALRNVDIDIYSLNYAVQLTIDRILFFRMAEDRGIEKYGTLLELTKNEKIYENLMKLFKKADEKYNSGLFCLTANPDNHINRDLITENLIIDDDIFKKIFKNLYYPNSPYEFSVISIDILGQVYEQFLGSEIYLTKKHRARVKQKPQIKKQGGVFYTEEYIVKYMVSNTVGKLIKGKTPNQISKMRILDPSCGSGSFLIVAYQELLNYHLNYYMNLERVPGDVIYYDKKDNEWRLTIREKKRILKNNIYGVDIDFLAVEVTKLSLLLKVLEDQNKDDLERQQKLFPERVLPDLSDNIKCGNSLISFDHISGKELSNEEISVLNPFNWEDEFTNILNEGGFDVIVGNPPYVEIENIKNPLKSLLKSNYDSTENRFDLYVLFIEKSLNLLKEKGLHSFIVPDKLCSEKYTKIIREKILDNTKILEIVDFSPFKLFKNAGVKNVVYTINKERSTNNYTKIINPNPDLILNKQIIGNSHLIKQSKFQEFASSLFLLNYTHKMENLFRKIDNNSIKLNEICYCSFGLQPGNLKKFVFNENINPERKSEHPECIKKFIKGGNINRYEINFSGDYVFYLPQKLHRPAFKELFDNPKIMISSVSLDIVASYDENMYYANETTVEVLPWYNINDLDENIIRKRRGMRYNQFNINYSKKYNLKYLLALLNSNLLNFYFKILLSNNIRVYPDYVKNLPICKTTDENVQKLTQMADKMIILKSELSNSKAPQNKNLLNNQIKLLEKEINKFIYGLYGLSNEEIKIIEENS